MYTVRQVAERLGVSASTVYSLAASGRLRACRVGNGRGVLRFTDDQVEAYLRSCETTVKPTSHPHRPRVVPPLRHLKL